MNWHHLQAFVWLRWRLIQNGWRRAGAFSAIVMIVFTVCALVTAVPLFIASTMLGVYLIPKASPAHLMYTWDAVLLAFLFFWAVGLLVELQKSEPLSLAKFLHLPVSVTGAFLINYLSSFLRLSLILFGPIMIGYSLALVMALGLPMLPVLPLLAAFVLMITGLSYQFQGWLASLMSNPRLRRTVVVMATVVFVLVAQLPNFVNMYYVSEGARTQAARAAYYNTESRKLRSALKSRQINVLEFTRRQKELDEAHKHAGQEARRQSRAHWEHVARVANLVLPVGWLPLGVMSAAEGRVLPSLLGLLGMTAIGTVSLCRAYRTTLRLYQGQPTNRPVAPSPLVAASAGARQPGSLLLEARIPGVSEPVSAVALGGFRALMRAPEAKMMLLMPLIMGGVFGSMLANWRNTVPQPVRPLIGFGAMGFVLLGLLQIMANQFGFDRDGFRAFVLSAAPRRDVLLGKNLAFAPLALGMAASLLVVVQTFCPMRLDHFVAMFPQYVSMFLLFCTLSNLMSIYTPFYVAPGVMKPSNPKLSTVLVQLAMVFILIPLTQGPTLLPLGIEALLHFLGWTQTAPICLVLTLVECALVVVLYRLALNWQGGLLQAREQRILETVTSRAA